MKIKSFITCIIVLCTSYLHAQKSVDISERKVTMSTGEHTGYTLTIQDADDDEVKDMLENWLEEKNKKADLTETGKNEWMINDYLTPGLSDKPIDIYFLIEEENNDTKVTAFYDLGDVYVSSETQPSKHEDAKSFLRNFAYRAEKTKIQQRLAEVEESLNKVESERTNLEKSGKELNEDLTDCQETIEKAKNELIQNAKDQEAKKQEIANQQKALDDIKKELQSYETY